MFVLGGCVLCVKVCVCVSGGGPVVVTGYGM